MLQAKIKISTEPRLNSDLVELAKLYPVIPSSKSGRDWWEKLKSFFTIERHITEDKIVIDEYSTFKYCPGVFDFTTCGYMVRWIHDMEFYISNDGAISWNLPPMIPSKWVLPHEPRQHEGCPISKGDGGHNIIKVQTPFLIETPKNWSVLFCKPFYSFNNYFDQCPGILDADQKHYSCHAVNVFFRFNVRDKVIKFKAGDPIIQLIPFKRISTKLIFNEKASKEIEKQYTRRLIKNESKFRNNPDINGTTLLKYRTQKKYK